MSLQWIAIGAMAALFGCGGSGETPPAQPRTAALGQSDGTAVQWADMNRDERIAHMKDTVVPRMADLFVAWKPEKYKDVDCTLCHGAGAKDGKFEMPNPDLPALGDVQKLMKEQPAVVEFMGYQVVPAMAEMIGLEPYDPKTHKGFGCAGCHVMEPGDA